MLPLLKDNIEKTEIAYFANTFMPLAFRLRTKSEEFSANKRLIEAKIFFTIQSQVCLVEEEKIFCLFYLYS